MNPIFSINRSVWQAGHSQNWKSKAMHNYVVLTITVSYGKVIVETGVQCTCLWMVAAIYFPQVIAPSPIKKTHSRLIIWWCTVHWRKSCQHTNIVKNIPMLCKHTTSTLSLAHNSSWNHLESTVTVFTSCFIGAPYHAPHSTMKTSSYSHTDPSLDTNSLVS